MFHHRFNQTAKFQMVGTTPPAADPTAGGGNTAANLTASSTDAVKQQYQQIFQEQMAQQAALYGDITKLNDQKNEQSSYLSLAKGVSEMV